MAATQKDESAIVASKQLANIPAGEQYERMISGMLYDSFVPELVNARFRARQLMHKFNTHFPEDATLESLTNDREAVLSKLFGRCGKESYVEPPLSVDYGSNISIGERFYANFNTTILDCALVTIGDRVLFGPNVSIYTATHETDIQSRRDNIEYAKPITIGNDCWIGGNVVVLPGVNIGKGCTIGSGSVVTKDIPDWSVAVGSPARVIKKVDPKPDL